MGIALTFSIFVPVSGAIEIGADPSWSRAASFLVLLLGGLAALLAATTWRRRPRGRQVPALPPWLETVDRLDVRRAAGLGALLSAANPKNFLICLTAGTTIARSGLSVGHEASVVLVFVVIASSTVALPALAYAVAKQRVAKPLDWLRGW